MHHSLNVSKNDGAIIYDADDLDLVIPKYNFSECSSDYSDIAGSLWCR